MKVLQNTYALNETLHKMDIGEKLRSQFVGTVLLHVKELVKYRWGLTYVGGTYAKNKMKEYVNNQSAKAIRSDIGDTLEKLLDGSDNKTQKIVL